MKVRVLPKILTDLKIQLSDPRTLKEPSFMPIIVLFLKEYLVPLTSYSAFQYSQLSPSIILQDIIRSLIRKSLSCFPAFTPQQVCIMAYATKMLAEKQIYSMQSKNGKILKEDFFSQLEIYF